MKHFKKLSAKGFAHWVIPVVAIVVIGSIGSYLLTRSHADSASNATTVCGSDYKKITAKSLTYNNGNTAPALAELYANANTKTICAFTYSTGIAYGVAKPMEISMRIYRNSDGKVITNRVNPRASYKYFGGPVKINASPYVTGKYSVYFAGSIKFNGRCASGPVNVPYTINSNFTFSAHPQPAVDFSYCPFNAQSSHM